MQAYEGGAEATQPLIVFATFFKGAERVFETKPTTVNDKMDVKSKAVPLRMTARFAFLKPDRYTCQITVLDPTTQKAFFWQAPIRDRFLEIADSAKRTNKK